MKTLIIMTCFALAFSFSACHHEQAPEKVNTAFHQKYPHAEEVEWEWENGHWEAEFENGEKEMTATFNQNGKWLETEMEDEDLPAAVKETLKSQFKNYEWEESEYVESPMYAGYEVELEGNKEEYKVLIAKDGKVLKKEMKDND